MGREGCVSEPRHARGLVLSDRRALVEKLVWIYVYGGLILLGLGLSVRRSDAGLGWSIAAIGALVTVAGAVLIWVRSRMKDPPR